MQYTLGLIGGGNMAEAVVRAAIGGGVLEPAQMIVSDPTRDRRSLFRELGVEATEDNDRVCSQSEQIMLAVKPQKFSEIRDHLGRIDASEHVIISIMAGLQSRVIAEAVGAGARVIRVMPNTPLLVGEGMAGICLGGAARTGDEALALRVFGSAGRAVVIKEKLMDALTAVSGSGPAYLYYLAESMAEAAVSMGLSEENTEILVKQTLLGAARLLSKSGRDARELRKRVTSPGGTTEAAVKHLDEHQVRRSIVEAIQQAEKRGRELGSV
ncbi:MAG: pyrroline-5-carboxylate reductase [Phycisphaeraceae bacterium]|nr:pyrroline-5-carboxylate reductase [Phycisphaeraceae bacterium]